MQYVKVDLEGRAYTYSWDDQKYTLQPGDIVLVPGNVVNPKSQQAPVLRILEGPDYDGKITEILAVSSQSQRRGHELL